MDFMKDLPDKHYDLAIVDPPYGIGDFNMQTSIGNKRGTRKHGHVMWNDNIPNDNYFCEIYRISKKNIIWGANYYNCFSGGAIIWHKQIGHPNMSKCEIASVSFQKKVDFVSIPWASGFYREIAEDKTIHPCQKPIALYKWLLQNYAKPGQTIFDSHVGSGSLRIACHDLGFDFEGCEIDEDYWEAQEARYQNHIKQAELFEPQEVQELVYKQGEL